MFDIEKYKGLDKEFKKKYGDHFKSLNSATTYEAVERIPVVCPSLNSIMGGGLPIGRVMELFGQPSSGKTSLAYHFIHSVQKNGGVALFIDAECSFDPTYAGYCGVDLDALCLLEPKDAQEALDAVRTALTALDEDTNKSLINLIIVDSVAALIPSEEYQKEVGAGMIGSLARLMSHSLKQIANLASKYGTTVIFINQERSTNLMGYGAKTGTTGGVALQYYTSIRLDISRTGWLEGPGGQKIGTTVKVETVKNKTATPMRLANLELIYPIDRGGITTGGIDVEADIINLAISKDIIAKNGAWFSYNGNKVQGMDKLKTYLLDNPDVYTEVYDKVIAAI